MTAGLLTIAVALTPLGSPAETPYPQSPYNPTSRIVTSGHATVAGDDVAGKASIGGAKTVLTMGQVYEPAYCVKHHLHGSPTDYSPQAGDIVLFSSDGFIWPLLLATALTHEPYHVGIVVKMCDGSFRLLEAGPPEIALEIRLTSLPERIETDRGRVFIRRRAVPLTAEQSDALTGFALRQEGKHYALIRFLLQGTPIRTRGPFRTHHLGKSRGEPCSYFCSELVMEALVSAGLTDVETARPRATTMADIFYDQSTNPYINQHLKLYPEWMPPQQWTASAR